jgi:hypothetical protein
MDDVTIDGKSLAVVLQAKQHLWRGEWVWSPSGEYAVGLDSNGNFEMKDKYQTVIWSAGVSNALRCKMQTDGNLVLRDIYGRAIWTSKTSRNRGAHFVISNAGQILIYHESNVLWFDGIPAGIYDGPSSKFIQ